MPAAAALASDRRAPTIAQVEWAYAIFQIKRNVSKANLRWYERLVFWYAWIPFMRFCTTRLHLPLWEVPDWVKCPGCGQKVSIPGGGCWTEKEGIVTTREMAVAACECGKSDESVWYFHKEKVNAVMTGETERDRPDHDFPFAGTKAYRHASTDVYEGSLSDLERLNHRLGGAVQKAAHLNSATR